MPSIRDSFKTSRIVKISGMQDRTFLIITKEIVHILPSSGILEVVPNWLSYCWDVNITTTTTDDYSYSALTLACCRTQGVCNCLNMYHFEEDLN